MIFFSKLILILCFHDKWGRKKLKKVVTEDTNADWFFSFMETF